MQGVFCFIKLTTGDNLLAIVDIAEYTATDTKIQIYFPMRLVPDEFGQYKSTGTYCAEDWLFGTEDKSMKLPMGMCLAVSPMNDELENFYSEIVDLDEDIESGLEEIKAGSNVVSLFNKNQE